MEILKYIGEIWKPIAGYEDYEVSNFGRVRSLNRYVKTSRGNGLKPVKGKILKLTVLHNGYVCVRLCANNKQKMHLVHRLVAIAFIPNPNNLPQINHKDENKLNNFVFINPDGSVNPEKSNLEWCNMDYNIHYGTGIKRSQEKQVSQGVYCYSLDGQFVKKFISIRQAAKLTGANRTNIKFCCENKPKYKTAGGFKWRYA